MQENTKESLNFSLSKHNNTKESLNLQLKKPLTTDKDNKSVRLKERGTLVILTRFEKNITVYDAMDVGDTTMFPSTQRK